jgi:hypothetical protein
MKRVLGLIILLSVFCRSELHAQEAQQDSIRNMVFEALTRSKPFIAGTLASQIKNSTWEALAYWETSSPKKIEYMREAVGDIYQFKVNEFVLELRDPDRPGDYLQPINGNYSLAGSKIVMGNAKGAVLVAEVFYVDDNYLVFNLEGLRIFLVKIKVNASK